jgi:phospholipid N-methyltransferase
LEAGAGNGDLTKHFVKKLGLKDRLDLVEIDDVFCRELRRLYGNDSRIYIYNMPIQDWKPAYKYDAVVASIPLNALPTPDILRSVLDAYVGLTKEGGSLSAVEYIGTSTLKSWTVFGEKSKAFQEVVAQKKDFFGKYCFSTAKVLQNLPPARVMHCRISASLPHSS